MKINLSNNRIGEHKKLGTKPKWLTKNTINTRSFQARSYRYNTLPKDITTASKLNILKKESKYIYYREMSSSNRFTEVRSTKV